MRTPSLYVAETLPGSTYEGRRNARLNAPHPISWRKYRRAVSALGFFAFAFHSQYALFKQDIHILAIQLYRQDIVVGAFLAGGVGLLLATQTGSNLRGAIRRYASKATDEVAERGREVWDTAVERGKEYMETGRHAMSEAGRTAREYVETGKEAMGTSKEGTQNPKESRKEAGQEATKKR